MNSRKAKIEFLRGLVNGNRSIQELLSSKRVVLVKLGQETYRLSWDEAREIPEGSEYYEPLKKRYWTMAEVEKQQAKFSNDEFIIIQRHIISHSNE